MDLSGVFTLTGLLALGWKGLDFIKYLRAYLVPDNQDSRKEAANSVVTQFSAWALFVGLIFLAGTANVFANEIIQDVRIVDMDGESKVYLGLYIGSFASVLYDFKKARDNSDTASTPKLLS